MVSEHFTETCIHIRPFPTPFWSRETRVKAENKSSAVRVADIRYVGLVLNENITHGFTWNVL